MTATLSLPAALPPLPGPSFTTIAEHPLFADALLLHGQMRMAEAQGFDGVAGAFAVELGLINEKILGGAA